MTNPLEALLLAQRPPTPVVDLRGVVESQTPYTVRCTGDDPDAPAAECVAVAAKATNGAAVLVLQIGRHRYGLALGTAAAADLGPLTTRVDAAEADITSLDGRLDAAEATSASQNSRLASLESADAGLDSRLDTAEATATDHGTRLATLEARTLVTSGYVNVSLAATTTAGQTAATGTITLSGYTATPRAFLQLWGSHANLDALTCLVTAVTATQISYRITANRATSALSAVPLMWMAVR